MSKKNLNLTIQTQVVLHFTTQENTTDTKISETKI
ncbi:MAG: hypothetical protein N4J56_002478 [Chroococcidiopsis sp. SAG 2025]|nr:hypothetical protein [Chroococcidiopsis sp. SAG 2025]